MDHQLPDWITAVLFNPELSPLQQQVNWGFFSALLWVILEPMSLSIFGTTPGKALFRLRLVSDNNEPNYWGRSIAVWAAGVGFNIPVVSFFTILNAGTRLKQKGKTDWDRWTGFSVEAEPLSIIRIVALTVLLMSLIMADSIMKHMENKITTTQVQIKSTQKPPKWEDLYSAEELSQRAHGLYNQGRYAEALPLFHSLAEQGNVIAQSVLAFMYNNGQGVAQDYNQAIYWYRKAAEQGDAFGQNNLGVMYANGQGVMQDQNQAVLWYRKAAEQGDEDAIAALNKLSR